MMQLSIQTGLGQQLSLDFTQFMQMCNAQKDEIIENFREFRTDFIKKHPYRSIQTIKDYGNELDDIDRQIDLMHGGEGKTPAEYAMEGKEF